MSAHLTTYCPDLLNRTFAFIVKLYNRMPLEHKSKKLWLEKRHKEKLSSLVLLQNAAIKEPGFKLAVSTTFEIPTVSGREVQAMETVMENLGNFVRNEKGSFYEFITIGKKITEAPIIDLFSMMQAAPILSDSNELPLTQKICKNHARELSLSEVIHRAVLVFKEMNDKQGHKKYAALFSDFVLYDADLSPHINFPLIVLQAFAVLKAENERKFLGRRIMPIQVEDLTEEKIGAITQAYLKHYLKQLNAYIKQETKFENMQIEAKISINYLLNKGYDLPEQVIQKGFSYTHPVVVNLFKLGMISQTDLLKDGGSLLAELLEQSQYVCRTTNNGLPYLVNVCTTTTNSWKKFNTLNNLLHSTIVHTQSYKELMHQHIGEHTDEQPLSRENTTRMIPLTV